MPVSPDVLINPRLKVQRAYCHIDELVARTSPLCPDWYSIQVGPDPEPPDGYTGYSLRYSPTQPIAKLVALIIGDAVHNLRGALDHLATGIARVADETAEIHFPMRKDRKDLVAPRAAKDSAEKAFAAIERALPGSEKLILDKIRPSNGANEPFWAFHGLNNDDKHNLILPTMALTSVVLVQANVLGMDIRNFTLSRDAANPINLFGSSKPFSVEGDFEATVDIKFGQGTAFEDQPVIPTLTQIAGVVSNAIDEFETLINNPP